MQECYADTAIFTDEVFVNLTATEVKAMWKMLCGNPDLKIVFSNVVADENKGTADWEATYTFSKTNRKVINRIKADFIFSQGRIIRHTDHFNFHNWAAQALGITGIVLGWTTFLKNKVRKEARKRLSQQQ